MSGHSHWATIRHKKGAADAKKGKIFSKIARLITVAAREAGGDPTMNLKLLYAIEEARAVNMPKDNIERAIKKGTGELAGEQIESFLYEGYGPGGVAVIVEGLTDNKTRSSNELRTVFERNGANMASPNSVLWTFERKGLFHLLPGSASEDQVMADVLDSGAENLEPAGDVVEVTCNPVDFAKVKKGLETKYKLRSGTLAMIPKSYVKVDEETGRRVLELLEALDNHDDVNQVYSNFELPETMTSEPS